MGERLKVSGGPSYPANGTCLPPYCDPQRDAVYPAMKEGGGATPLCNSAFVSLGDICRSDERLERFLFYSKYLI